MILSEKIDSMLQEKLIADVVDSDSDQFLSNIFLRPKRNGGHRFFFRLNLSELNKCIEYKHFKMETFAMCLILIGHNCFMGSVDLRDAYYSVSFAADSRKFLRFVFNNKLYEFTCMPNGLACAPRIFTKLLKPVFSFLRSRGFLYVYYLDDSLIIGGSKEECEGNLRVAVNLLHELGFIVNMSKSVLTPVQDLEFWGSTLILREWNFTYLIIRKRT